MASSSSSSSEQKVMEENGSFISSFPSYDPSFHRYHVFLSHRVPDVKNTVASLLYQSLQCSGINVFLDSAELLLRDSLPVNIQHAICGSAVQIAIFSAGYANSPWCMAELQLMLKTGRKMVPLFYGVAPSDLRHVDKGVYAEAFATYRRKNMYIGKLDQWKQALREASTISGIQFDPSNGNMGNLCTNIVNIVVNELRDASNRFKLEVADHPVGLDEAIQELDAKISTTGQTNKENGKIVGIVGRAGVGKTTLVKEFYNRKRLMFWRSSFLSDVAEAHRNKKMMWMQQKLMCDLSTPMLLSSPNFRSNGLKEGFGVESIKSQLERWHSKPLIILDGVDHADQLKVLALNEFLNHGALVIVTCRDVNVVDSFEMVKIYEMRGLDLNYAKQLFSWYAFRRSDPPNGWEKFVKAILKVSGGLPLHLKDLGQAISSMRNDIKVEV